MKNLWTVIFAAILAWSAFVHADSSRWKDNGNRTLTDAVTGLTWAREYNSEDVRWEGAVRFCKILGLAGGGWRLPEIDELVAIYAEGSNASIDCAPPIWRHSEVQCRTASGFFLTSFVFWSGTPAVNSGGAWGVDLSTGKRFSRGTYMSAYARALCVRRS